MEPTYSQIFEANTSGESLDSFKIDEEAEQRNHLKNAVLHCYMLVSVGLIRSDAGQPF
jgi:hypothetical protein